MPQALPRTPRSHSVSPPQEPSLSRLRRQLLEIQSRSLASRRGIIQGSKRDLDRSWRSLCSILKEDSAGANNREEQQIIDSCLQLIVRERIALEKENLQIEKLRNLYHAPLAKFNSSRKKQQPRNPRQRALHP